MQSTLSTSFDSVGGSSDAAFRCKYMFSNLRLSMFIYKVLLFSTLDVHSSVMTLI